MICIVFLHISPTQLPWLYEPIILGTHKRWLCVKEHVWGDVRIKSSIRVLRWSRGPREREKCLNMLVRTLREGGRDGWNQRAPSGLSGQSVSSFPSFYSFFVRRISIGLTGMTAYRTGTWVSLNMHFYLILLYAYEIWSPMSAWETIFAQLWANRVALAFAAVLVLYAVGKEILEGLFD